MYYSGFDIFYHIHMYDECDLNTLLPFIILLLLFYYTFIIIIIK